MNGNFYVVIKIIEDDTSIFIKYNLLKEKEFSSYDCSSDAVCFFNDNKQSFILDGNSILDLNQGIPLYYYQSGKSQYSKQYQLGKSFGKGSRFCQDPHNPKFLIRNRVVLPYCYQSLLIITKNKGVQLSIDNYDPNSCFCVNGSTSLHSNANNFS